jgi:hypothetical protein
MRFKTFRRKHGKMSRRRGRAGQGKLQVPASDEQMNDMEQGIGNGMVAEGQEDYNPQHVIDMGNNGMGAQMGNNGMANNGMGAQMDNNEMNDNQTGDYNGTPNNAARDRVEYDATGDRGDNATGDAPGPNGMGGRRKRKTRKGRKGKKTRGGKKGGKKGKSHRR